MTKSTPLSQLPLLGNSSVAQERQNQIPSLPLPVNTNIGNDINEDNDETIKEALSQFQNDSVGGQNPNIRYEENSQLNQLSNRQFGALPHGLPSQVSQGHSSMHNSQLPLPGDNTSQTTESVLQSQSPQSLLQSQKIIPQSQSNQQGGQYNQNQFDKPRLYGVSENGSHVEIEKHDPSEDNEEGFRDEDDVISSYGDVTDEGGRKSNSCSSSSYFSQFVNNNELKRIIIVMIVFGITTALPLEQFASKYVPLEKVPFSNIILKAIFAGILYFIITSLV